MTNLEARSSGGDCATKKNGWTTWVKRIGAGVGILAALGVPAGWRALSAQAADNATAIVVNYEKIIRIERASEKHEERIRKTENAVATMSQTAESIDKRLERIEGWLDVRSSHMEGR